MPEQQIQNAAGAWQAGASWGTGVTPTADQRWGVYQNNSGGALKVGDVVVVDVTGSLITSTTTANDFTVRGVVAPPDPGNTQTDGTTYAAGKPVPVITQGVARINIGGNAVAANDQLTTSTGAKVAATNAATTVLTAVGTIIGIALEASAAKDANNTIRAIISKM